MEEALSAYGCDPDYAVAMCSKASAIHYKRSVWAARTELRIAEAHARTECESAEPFTCDSIEPCGTGTACRFAAPALVSFTVPPPRKPTRSGTHVHRLQQRSDGAPSTYNLEEAVIALRDARPLFSLSPLLT